MPLSTSWKLRICLWRMYRFENALLQNSHIIVRSVSCTLVMCLSNDCLVLYVCRHVAHLNSLAGLCSISVWFLKCSNRPKDLPHSSQRKLFVCKVCSNFMWRHKADCELSLFRHTSHLKGLFGLCDISKCRANFSWSLNGWWHSMQRWTISAGLTNGSLWTRTCFFNFIAVLNVAGHNSHLIDLRLWTVLMCLSIRSDRTNRLLQCWHTNSPNPVCTLRWCRRNADGCVNVWEIDESVTRRENGFYFVQKIVVTLSHVSHLYGLTSLWCTFVWMVRSVVDENRFGHWLQMYFLYSVWVCKMCILTKYCAWNRFPRKSHNNFVRVIFHLHAFYSQNSTPITGRKITKVYAEAP